MKNTQFDGQLLQHTTESLKGDEEVVGKAVTQNAWAQKFATEYMKSKFMPEAFTKISNQARGLKVML